MRDHTVRCLTVRRRGTGAHPDEVRGATLGGEALGVVEGPRSPDQALAFSSWWAPAITQPSPCAIVRASSSSVPMLPRSSSVDFAA